MALGLLNLNLKHVARRHVGLTDPKRTRWFVRFRDQRYILLNKQGDLIGVSWYRPCRFKGAIFNRQVLSIRHFYSDDEFKRRSQLPIGAQELIADTIAKKLADKTYKRKKAAKHYLQRVLVSVNKEITKRTARESTAQLAEALLDIRKL